MKQFLSIVAFLMLLGCGSGSENKSTNTYYEGNWGYDDSVSKLRVTLIADPLLIGAKYSVGYTGIVQFQTFDLNRATGGYIAPSSRYATSDAGQLDGQWQLAMHAPMVFETQPSVTLGTLRPANPSSTTYDALIYSDFASGLSYTLKRL